MLMSAELRGCITWFTYFLILLKQPHHWAAPKMPILNRVKIHTTFFKSKYFYSNAKKYKKKQKTKKLTQTLIWQQILQLKKTIFIKFEIHISQLTVNMLLKKRSFNQIRHCLAGHNPIWHHFLSTNIKVFQWLLQSKFLNLKQ